MKPTFHRRAMVITFIMVCVAILAGTSAQAQTAVDIINNTTCEVDVVLYDGSTPQSINSFTVKPGLTSVTLSPGFVPVGAKSAAGSQNPFVNGCTGCIALRAHVPPAPPATCCAVVCFNPNLSPAVITVNPCGPTCAP